MDKQRVQYNKELLDTIILRDNATLSTNLDKLNVYTIIPFICSCGKEYSKNFRSLYRNSGGFCKDCSKVIGKQKSEKTNIEKFGCANPFGSKEIQDKIKKDRMEKHGVEYSTQIKQVIEKIKNTNNSKSPEEKAAKSLKTKQTNLKVHGYSNPSQSPEIKKKKEETLMKNHGVTNPNKSPSIRAKILKTVKERYDQDNVSKVPAFIEKIKEALLLKTDEQRKVIQEKKTKTSLEKYGKEHPSQAVTYEEQEKRNKKREETCIDRYNVRNPIQNPQIFKKMLKSSYKLKAFIMPSGKVVKVQGYEPFALEDLLKKYSESQIIVGVDSDMPTINYIYDDKPRVYTPDIFIPHENRIIEIKSNHTYYNFYDKNLSKAEECIKLNYLYEVLIYNKKGIIEERVEF
jgi:hypothetical protein